MMKQAFLLVAVCSACICDVDSIGIFRKQFPRETHQMLNTGVDPGQPLFLTPYIEQGEIDQARQLSKVGQLNGTNVPSFSGFLTVNKTYNSNMFFWFFPSESQQPKDPVLLWLQGGPGGSSLFGLFVENGPFGVDKDQKLFPRKFSWTTKYNVLYIDNPVGTGFSFTDNDLGYARTEEDVADNLYKALYQFFELFPELIGNELYLTGESYAGKYIPALAYRIHKEPFPKKIYLRGVAIGDGFSDPPVMIHAYAEFLFQTGLMDEIQRDQFRTVSNEAGRLIDQKRWKEAFELFDVLMDSDITTSPSFYTNCTGMVDYYNYLRSTGPVEYDYYNSYVARSDVRLAIHVGNLTYHADNKVEIYLMDDIMQSVKPYLTVVMNYYKVMLYSGQLDVIVALPLTEAMIQTIDWEHQAEYRRVNRMIWKVRPEDTEVAGYVRRVHDFYQVLVRGGGHILPFDQPERSWDMIDRFVTGRPFA